MLGKLSDVLVLPNKPDRIAKKYLSLFDMQVLFPLPQTVLSKKKSTFSCFHTNCVVILGLSSKKLSFFKCLASWQSKTR